MATVNPFDLLGDDDAENPLELIASQQPKKVSASSGKPAIKQQTQQQNKPAAAQLPSKPLPPSQAVREAKSDSSRGGRGGRRGYGRSRGGGDSTYNDNSYGNRRFSGGEGPTEETDTRKPSERYDGYGGPRVPFRGRHRGGFSNREVGEGENRRPRRAFERHSGTGQGNEMKREGAGHGNWGTLTDEPTQEAEEVDEGDKNLNAEKPVGEENATEGYKETPVDEVEEKEPEDKEMTLEEYEKVMEERRNPLQALKTEERKVDVKEFESMQQLANKRNTDDIFVKLGSEKDKRKELTEKEERVKKSVGISKFLKATTAERYYSPGGRGRDQGRGFIGGYSGGGENKAPFIEDPRQFPTLGGK
ncbi:RGG repeats nuclear RNA binding protein A-like isoform X1 [Olea europaea var. sylvestris]|uniref:RGG repeats nuclear RNA binding protein A-like isoform X1 n=1 Tax=Olea europaea var. sylvestris TaxID=158386 RepID=UPI000C1D1D73|nr:RGG repeats nuclear RNA binding protein A-like isoform X1 [Olea europaea var. sylvestris]